MRCIQLQSRSKDTSHPGGVSQRAIFIWCRYTVNTALSSFQYFQTYLTFLSLDLLPDLFCRELIEMYLPAYYRFYLYSFVSTILPLMYFLNT